MDLLKLLLLKRLKAPLNTLLKMLKMVPIFVLGLMVMKDTTMASEALTQSMVEKLYSLKPPTAAKIPQILKMQGEEFTDNYAWLRDSQWPKVEEPKILAYLQAENAYADGFFDHYKPEIEKLSSEIKSRIKLKDSTVPVKKDNYYYYSRTEEDSEHPIYCRKKGSLEAKEEIILDANAKAKGQKYFEIGTLQISNDQQRLIYSEDLTGGDRYGVKVKELSTGKIIDDKVKDSFGSVIWNKEGTGFFYAKLNDQWRSTQAFFHKLGDDPSKDKLLYKEEDPIFSVQLAQSNSKRFLFIVTGSKDSSEIRYLDLDQPSSLEPTLIQVRQQDMLYDVDHHEDLFFVLTNDKGRNFRLATTPIKTPGKDHWKDYIPYHKDKYLSDFTLYQHHLVYTSKEQGLNKIKIVNLATKGEETLKFPDPGYEADSIFTTYEDSGARISYSSLLTPDTIYEYDFKNKQLNTLKVMEIPSGYNKELYEAERIFVIAKDGTKIPVSIAYKKSLFKKDGKNPVYLYGYGSYGSAVPSSFRPSSFTMLDRGFVYVIAHVRGGDEMGYEWYESAKFLTKKNTFDDFIRVAEFLSQEKYTSQGNISITGRSAGGMLVGVVVNERPELFKAVIADVPFVDVLNTMWDENLPLTPGEYKEWGNPRELPFFQYIKSYSPYENVKAQNYPNFYVRGSINDPRVTYWEPAKWVAKLREMKTDNNLILFSTNMEAGHAGSSGRFSHIKDLAKEYLFILLSFGRPI